MELEVFEWSEIKETRLRNFEKRMLLKGGLVLEMKCHLKHESPRVNPSQVRLVRFDRSFIAYKLAKVLEPIADASEGIIADLMQEALFILANKEDGFNGVVTSEIELEEDDEDSE